MREREKEKEREMNDIIDVCLVLFCLWIYGYWSLRFIIFELFFIDFILYLLIRLFFGIVRWCIKYFR